MLKPVETLLNNIANLFKVKTIITVMVLAALTVGFLNKFVPVELYASLATAIITYYFNRDKKED